MTTTDTCPDCGKQPAKVYGDGGCLARCPDIFFRNATLCRIDTIARMRPVVEAAVAWADSSPERQLLAEDRLLNTLKTSGFPLKLESGELGEAAPK